MNCKTKIDYKKDEYIAELISLWEEVVRKVYLKDSCHQLGQMAESAWQETNMTPFDFVKRFADPNYMPNKIERGQKARVKRWNKWLKRRSK